MNVLHAILSDEVVLFALVYLGIPIILLGLQQRRPYDDQD